MRLIAATASITQAIATLSGGSPMGMYLLNLASAVVALLLLVGLWTPIAGALMALIEFWNAFSQPKDLWTHILLGTLGAALALIGPGAWSVDARLFGWRRIEVPTRKR